MATKATTATEVEIFGGVYQVRAGKDSEYLQELAELVDTKMREISQQVSTVDSAKIAILAALNIADELFQCRQQQDGERVRIEERVSHLAGELSEALES
jgi:cell division protein ZapA